MTRHRSERRLKRDERLSGGFIASKRFRKFVCTAHYLFRMRGGGMTSGDILIVRRKICRRQFLNLIAKNIRLILTANREQLGKAFFQGNEFIVLLAVIGKAYLTVIINCLTLKRLLQKRLICTRAVNIN